MKVKMLRSGRWALSVTQQIAFRADDIVTVPDEVGREKVRIGWGVKVEEQKAINPVAENKMFAPGLENKSDDTLIKQIKAMSKEDLVTFARENDIKVDARESYDKTLERVLDAFK